MQKRVWLLCYFDFEKNYVLKFKRSCFLLNKKQNFNTNETESKMENPIHDFTERNLCASDELELTEDKRVHFL